MGDQEQREARVRAREREIGVRLRLLVNRDGRGLEEIAGAAGLSLGDLEAMIDRPDVLQPTLRHLLRLEDALDLTGGELWPPR